jgi:RimJ/RimL family protein N-acetyltransferase
MAARTARLRIESLRPRHAQALFDVLADPRIYAYIPDHAHDSVDSLAEHYARLERGPRPGSIERWLNWALARRDTQAYIGTLQATVMPDTRAYIGYVLATSAWGQGFATEACGWLLAELERGYRTPEILATVDSRNEASIRLLERLGFVRIAVQPAELRGEATTDYRYRRRGASHRSVG